MRAIIPAVVLLFIGLVAALPFRRPPSSLDDPTDANLRPLATVPSGQLPQPMVAPDTMQPTWNGNADHFQNGMGQIGSGVALGQVPGQPPIAEPPLATSYNEIMIPLAQPVDQKMEVLPKQQAASEIAQSNPGAWRTGLVMSNQTPRRLPSTNNLPAPVAPIDAIVRVPVESQLLNQPPQSIDSGRANAQLAATPISAKPNEASPPAPTQDRPKRFIREPQR